MPEVLELVSGRAQILPQTGEQASEPRALSLCSILPGSFHRAPFPAQSVRTAPGASLTQHCFFQFSIVSFMGESVFQVSFSDGGVEAPLSEQGV